MEETPHKSKATVEWLVTPSFKNLPMQTADLDLTPTGNNGPLKKKPKITQNLNHESLKSNLISSLQSMESQEVPPVAEYVRYLVLEQHFEPTEYGRQQMLRVLNEMNSTEKKIMLQDGWADAEVSIGQYVNVFMPSQESEVLFISNNSPDSIIIINPDVMLPVTTIANSFDCARRAIIQSRIKPSEGSASLPLVSGRILHELFQAAIVENNFETAWLSQQLQKLVDGSIEDLYLLDMTESRLFEELLETIPVIQQWQTDNMQRPSFIKNAFASRGFVGAKKTKESDVGSGNEKFKLLSVLDIEERIWSTAFGIKGNIDATIKITNGTTTKMVPLELKTGRGSPSISHRTQMMIYTFLLSDKYKTKITDGMISYLNKNGTQFLTASEQEKKAILQQRNSLSAYFSGTSLPPLLQCVNSCSRCYVSDSCMTLHKVTKLN
jgi:DNA replication ATP-dependent helicase Dna2